MTRLIAIVMLGACTNAEHSDSGTSGRGGGGLATTLDRVDDAIPLTQDNRCEGETIAFDTPVLGAVPGGYVADFTDWFEDSQVACTPFGAEFPGPYSVTRIPIPADSRYEIVANPDDDVDVTLVAWFQAPDDGCYPERGALTPRCASSNRTDRGGNESVVLETTNNGFEIVILVGTPLDGPAGSYKLTVRNP